MNNVPHQCMTVPFFLAHLSFLPHPQFPSQIREEIHVLSSQQLIPHYTTNEIPLSANTCPRTNTSQCVERKTSLVGQMVFIQEGILEDKRILTRDFFIIHFFFLPSVISFLWIFKESTKMSHEPCWKVKYDSFKTYRNNKIK